MTNVATDDLVGRTLSHFRIIDRIGRGGMGVVYRARDEQLLRDVAIKVLPTDALADETARRRFRQEALTLARLNHPNIETVFDFETEAGLDYLVVEYIPGQTLEKRLRPGPLSESEAIPLSISIAEALEAAHARGVIHCDLKPSNIGLTPEHRVKILDFGIAQVLRPVDARGVQSTLASTATIETGGGTLPYMAPEQLLGKKLDGRVDIYALGVVLFHMVVGRPPFQQTVQAALTDEILHAPPPRPRTLNPDLSEGLEAIILRCLEKDPARRYPTAAHLRADLGRLGNGEAPTLTVRRIGRTPRFRVRRLVLAGLLVAAAATGLVFVLQRHSIREPRPPDRQVTFTGQAYYPAISPDGQYAAYVDRSILNRQRLFVQDLAGGEPLEVFSGQTCFHPRWSPDGSAILCRAVRGSEHAAFIVPKLGGTPRHFASAGIPQCWAPDGSRFASASDRTLQITDIATGEASATSLGDLSARVLDLDWSSANRIVLLATDDRGRYSIWTTAPGKNGAQKWFDDSSLVASPRWSPDGNVLYFIRAAGQEGLMDLCKITWKEPGKHRDVSTEVLIRGLAMGDYFTVSRDGHRLLYTREFTRSNLWRFALSRRGSSKAGQPLTTGTSVDGSPSISPDGRWVAYERGAGSRSAIFRTPMDGGDAQQLTFMGAECRWPVWSPAGDTIAFLSNQGGSHRIWRVAASGGPARPYPGVEIANRRQAPFAWAPGNGLLCLRANRNYVVLDPRSGSTTVIGSEDSLGSIQYPRFSHDGTRLAWWSPDPLGLWSMELASRSRTRVIANGPVIPLAWVGDDDRLYGLDWRTEKPSLVLLDVRRGNKEKHIDIPVPGLVGDVSLSPDATRAVCVVIAYMPDVWLAENFDPR